MLTRAELGQIEELKRSGVLVDVKEHKVTPCSIVVACGDGHEYLDVFDYHRDACRKNGKPMIHQHLTNGGALALQGGTTLHHGIAGDDLLIANLGDSMMIKKINSIVLRVHMPCGAARLIATLPLSQIAIMRLGRERILKAYPEATVSCYADVRYHDGRLRAYYVDMSA